jgi:uncharacterized protein (DUF2252 family)
MAKDKKKLKKDKVKAGKVDKPLAGIKNAKPTAAPPAPKIIHPRVAERIAVGKAAREKTPRADLGGWAAGPGRADPVAILESQSADRVPDLVPIRYGRMAVSPFTFLRGSAAIMAADLATLPRTTLTTQLCGDCHLANFGAFASPERNLVFDVNDFDETLRGPFEWDLKRLAVSFLVAARDVGLSEEAGRAAVAAIGKTYRRVIATAAGMTTLEVWYAHIDEAGILRNMPTGAAKGYVKEVAAKAQKRDGLQAVAKLTERTDAGLQIKYDPPLLLPESVGDVSTEVHRFLDDYRATLPDDRKYLLEHFRFVDLARKVVGVGSVGTRCWIALMTGRDDDDPMFLQVKEANPSVLSAFGGLPKTRYRNHGRRVVEGQRLTQAASDIFLGWDRQGSHDFYVRQLRDMKGSADLTTMDAPGLSLYAGVCAWALALGHARAGDRVAMNSYLGAGDTFDQALVSFAVAYADQNEADYAAFTQAIKSGRIRAASGY